MAPPYDVIPDSDLAHYRSLSPYNVVHLTRPGTDYEGAAMTFERWLDDRLLVISDPVIHASMHAALEDLPVLIADGHHRYETALAYAEEVGGPPEAATRFTLALLTDLGDPGLVVLPTHRVMKAGVAITGG